MRRDLTNRRRMIAVILYPLFLSACRRNSRQFSREEVEISPGTWLQLNQELGKWNFSANWQGQDIDWGEDSASSTHGNEKPIILREYNNILYLVTLDLEKISDPKFIFMKWNPQVRKFTPIPPNLFPKAIATENLGFNPKTRYATVGEESIDTWRVLRELDTENLYFWRFSLTGNLWLALETGRSLREIEDMPFDEENMVKRKELIQTFARNYKPIPLPVITKGVQYP